VGQPCLIAYVACETTPAQAAQARFSYCKAFAALQQLSEMHPQQPQEALSTP
jgi:hypothetical protein